MQRRTILVTRPHPDAERTAAGLAALGLDPIIAPMLEARFTNAPLPPAEGFAAIAVTSANGVRALAAHPGGEAFADLPVYAVGEQTAHEARATGFEHVLTAAGTLDDLARTITSSHPPGPILYAAARHQSGDLAGLLAKDGLVADTRILYDMQTADELAEDLSDRLISGAIEGAVFYSRRTAATFVSLLAGEKFVQTRRTLSCLCLSENTAEPLMESHFVRIGLADYPSNEAMMALALAFARDQISP